MLKSIAEWEKELQAGQHDARLEDVYGGASGEKRVRCLHVLERYEALYGEDEVGFFRAPGRTEIGGNHTDHQHGRVLAAAVDPDVLVVASPAQDGEIRICSEGFPAFSVSLSDLSPRPDEEGTSQALIRGTAAALQSMGYTVGGFSAYITSDVLSGSGLSSSAAFEVAAAVTLSCLYNGGTIPQPQLAIAAQKAENIYFGKPCGLMDQMASAVGGLVQIDFESPSDPLIRQVNADFSAFGHTLCIVDTGGSHADLTGDYAAVPAEMSAAARFFGKEVLREVDPALFEAQIPALREALGDRAVLRAMHFFAENDRVSAQTAALERGDFPAFLTLIRASGDSSWKYLQNVSAGHDPAEQKVPLALAASERFLAGRGAARVHGGGFAGTIQAFVPQDLTDDYAVMIERICGEGTCQRLSIRPYGGIELFGG